MASKSCSDEEFLALFKQHGPAETARLLGIAVRNVYIRRKKYEERMGCEISGPDKEKSTRHERYPKRIEFKIENGIAIVGSDAHFWPDLISTAHRGICLLSKELHPKLFCLNGDGFDGAGISRHPPIMWDKPPSVIAQLKACEERTDEIRQALPSDCKRIWTIGNHDSRFENRLASQASEFSDIKGFVLADHFPHWQFGWSTWINNQVVVKHRFKGGIHATHNNTMWAGKTIVTGHLHSLKVTPFSDYTGTRFGVDTGTLADPYGPQFDYAEDNPLNHRSGFVVLTFHNGLLLWPEVASVVDEDHIQFRGKLIKV